MNQEIIKILNKLKENPSSEKIIHEILHALGLQHTFKGAKHEFKQSKTDNHMDI